jgi:hypothetical protein
MHAAIHKLLPITEFRVFHPESNVNFQHKRFLAPGLEQQFCDIGAKIKGFGDWK